MLSKSSSVNELTLELELDELDELAVTTFTFPPAAIPTDSGYPIT